MSLPTTALEWAPNSSSRPHASNARAYPTAKVRRLADGIARIGVASPIMVGDDAEVIAGDGRLEAGFGCVEIDGLGARHGGPHSVQDLGAGKGPVPVWTLGRHRLVCGDAADAGVLARLLDGERVDAVMGEPPVGVPDTRQAITDVLRAVAPHATPAAVAILYAHVRQLVTLVRAGASCLVDPARGRSLPRMPALAMLLHAQSCAVPELREVVVACMPEDALVLDPFARTDATLAAAQASGRTARLVCADLATCHTIVERWRP